MKNLLNQFLTEPLKDFFQRIIKFLPNFLSALIIFVLGLVMAWIIKLIIVKILKLLHLDSLFSKMGISESLKKIGLKDTPVKILGRLFYWIIVVLFFIIAIYTLKVPAIEDFLEKFLLYLPNIFIAAVLIVIGFMLGNFLGRTVLLASVNAGIKFSGLLGKGVKTIIIFLAFVMALEQLGIGRSTVIAAFTILFGGIVFALALAFGLGGKDIAKEYLEKRYKKKPEDKDDISHI
jgi:hypothetical protein